MAAITFARDALRRFQSARCLFRAHHRAALACRKLR
jgi:hypothetical protein